ncbi:MAG: ABC transporter permease [Planctomycetes bacterium]|jgi:ribose/xylose/arabinose/galactoside ABC-type transport system permease subunit|nr:ABC transporter permease [Planctomycetota bacterium]
MNKFLRQLLPFGTLTLIIAALAALKPDTFLTMENFSNVLSRSSYSGIIAMGMTAVIISGGIDLSVGSMMALSGMVAGLVMTGNGSVVPTDGLMVLGSFVGILTGILCGVLNGGLITLLNLPPFIVTLGTMSAFRGLSLVMNNGMMFDVPAYTFLGEGTLAGIPVNVLIFCGIALAAFFLLRYTPLGRYTYAIGSNRQAAWHAGVNVRRNLIAVYTIAGLFVGIAAMIATSRTVSAQPNAGLGMELDVIAAVVIGGASLSGGRGTVVGTIVGTLLITFLRNGLTLLGISTNTQFVVLGAIIIAAVALDQAARAKAETA